MIMKDLSYLSTLDAVAFEVERARLITDAIMGAAVKAVPIPG